MYDLLLVVATLALPYCYFRSQLIDSWLPFVGDCCLVVMDALWVALFAVRHTKAPEAACLTSVAAGRSEEIH